MTGKIDTGKLISSLWDNDKYLALSFRFGSDDCKLFVEIWNQGIDARLEAFTESKHVADHVENRLHLFIALGELSILLRRLTELETDSADQWADDIVFAQFGHEII